MLGSPEDADLCRSPRSINLTQPPSPSPSPSPCAHRLRIQNVNQGGEENFSASVADFFVDDARWTASYVKLVLAKPSAPPYPDSWTICTEPVPV